jgi:glycosyltransferase involved in cell wall biosynthesis
MKRFSPGRSVRPGWTDGSFPLLFAARRLATGKGVLELVHAMPEILRTNPSAMLVVAGSGAEAKAVQHQIEALGVRQSVRLVGDLEGADLVNWIRCADLCVVPTQRPEPFGLSTVEALACGTPVVATPAGASRELLDPLDPRLILPGLLPADIARGVASAAGDSDLMTAVRATARSYVYPRYGWDQVVDSWAEIYSRQIAGVR